MLKKLVESTTADHIDEPILIFLAKLINDRCFPPQQFLFPFEVYRLKYTYYG